MNRRDFAVIAFSSQSEKKNRLVKAQRGFIAFGAPLFSALTMRLIIDTAHVRRKLP
jgi:hypothetical protein